MKLVSCLISAGAAFACVASSTPSVAWGWQGHEYVGGLAWKLLNPNARAHVSSLLGPRLSLSLAAVWPDCAKDALGPPGYRLNQRMLPHVCNRYSAADRKRMWDYTRRNWSNCEYSHKPTQCHRAFHFADINVHEHSDYDAGDFGAHPWDVVQAIKGLTTYLQCGDGQSCDLSPFPGNIASKREALLLLAHFVGDVHQPLHVGAVYLDPVTAEETGDTGLETIGGNSLALNASENLHHHWDTIQNPVPSNDAIAQACQLAPLPNPTPEPPEQWASESVSVAKDTYTGMSFTRVSPTKDNWTVQLADPAQYDADTAKVQSQRLIQAGARLAALLNSIWPSTVKSAACH